MVELLKYCYENATPESLKSLVLTYTACKAELLWSQAGFQELVETHGDLSRNLIGSLIARLD